jgi:hypothetical protein
LKQYLIFIISLLILFPLASAAVLVGQTSEVIQGVTIEIPSPIVFNNNTGGVNSSEFAEIWITTEGNKDNVADISLDEIGDVSTSPSNESLLSYDSGISQWISITLNTLHLQLQTFFFNITQTEERYYNKTDFNSNGVGHMVYTKSVDGNNVTMSTII